MTWVINFIRNMNFWNWLALIAFLIALMSGLNAFLGLKSRFRDWRGTQSKKLFEIRLKQFRQELRIIETFENNLRGYVVWVLDSAVAPLKFFGLAFMLLILTF